MTYLDLMEEHKYDEVIGAARLQLAGNSDDLAAIARLADALRAKGEYLEAIKWLERLDALRTEDEAFNRAAPGHPGARLGIACLHWLTDERSKAISQMHGLAAGILNRSIGYASDGLGIEQGLLLYYMGISANQLEEASYALDYLKNRVEHEKKLLGAHWKISWTCHLALYLLREIPFESVIARAESDGGVKLNLLPADAAERQSRAKRSRIALAVFHDGVIGRARGDEAHCLARMRECYAWENRSNTWYPSRHELQRGPRCVEKQSRGGARTFLACTRK
jgi:tetratricopeptide (TPR) repeat protein